MKINNKLLSEIYELAEIYSSIQEVYRAKAYSNAYHSLLFIKGTTGTLPDKIPELIKIDGIGKSIAEKIIHFQKHGYIKELKEFKKDKIIKKIIDITKIHGFGFKGAKKLYTAGYKTIDDIKSAYLNNKIKLTNQQKLGIAHYDDLNKPIPREEIKKLDDNINKSFKGYHIVGSYRREKPFSKDIDIITTGKLSAMIDFLKENYKYIGTLVYGKEKFSGLFILENTVRQIDILETDKKSYPTKLQYFTGSKEFNIKIRNVAISKGYKLSEQGLYKNNKRVSVKDEKDIFDILGMKYLKPNERV